MFGNQEVLMARVSHYVDNREKILTSVHNAATAHGKPPSVRDLAEEIDVGVATMHDYLKKLAEEGMVEWRKGRHRSLHLTPEGIQLLS